jgi:hypothetical protein
MFEDEPDQPKSEVAGDPAERAKEKSDEFRMHAEFAAVFEGHRKFDARVMPTLDANVARDIQRTVGRLEKSKQPESPILPPASVADAAALLDYPATRDLPTNDYLIHRRPGEAMIVRWLAGDEVESYYARMQAHFDAALEGFKEDERQGNAWRQDRKSQAFLTALDAIEVKMADRYLRDLIRTHNLFVLSTQTADEVNIAYLAGDVMGVSPAEIVGAASAPPDDAPTERDLAWFFKLFSLRGVKDGVEQMCFFTYLQKSDDESF